VRNRSWTLEQLREAVKRSRSYRQVLGALNLRQAGGNYKVLQKHIRLAGLDISHFSHQAWNRGLRYPRRPVRSLQEILTADSDFASFKLKKRLFDANLKPQRCEECGWQR
jgi:hypothetical protein